MWMRPVSLLVLLGATWHLEEALGHDRAHWLAGYTVAILTGMVLQAMQDFSLWAFDRLAHSRKLRYLSKKDKARGKYLEYGGKEPPPRP